MSDRTKAIIGLIFTSACYSVGIIAVRMMSKGLEDFTQVYLRIFLGIIIGVIVFNKSIRYKKVFTLPKKDLLTIVLMGVAGYALAVYFITVGSLKAKMVNVSIIFSTVPFWTYLYSAIFLKKRIQILPVILILVSFLGISIIATKSIIPKYQSFTIGEMYVLASAACFGIYYIGRKFLSDYLNNNELTITVMFFAFIGSLFFSFILNEKLLISNLFNFQVLIGLGISAISNVLTTKIEMFSFKKLNTVFGSQLLLFENLFSLILGYIFYHENILPPEIVGSILVIISVFFANKVIND
jgi:drug/metabolite transporter (DMT)-like permease